MQALLSEMGLAFTRVEAVDGKELDPDFIERVCLLRSDRLPWTPQEVGTALSHRKCWRLAAEADAEYSIILEDDLHFSKDAAQFLGSGAWLPENLDLVKLETCGQTVIIDRPTSKRGRQLVRLHSLHLGAGAYVLSRAFARKLLTSTEKISDPSDVVLFSKPLETRVYQLTPAICIQDLVLNGHQQGTALSSTMEDERNLIWEQYRPKKKRGQEKFWRELTRPVHQLFSLLAKAGRVLRGRSTEKIKFLESV